VGAGPQIRSAAHGRAAYSKILVRPVRVGTAVHFGQTKEQAQTATPWSKHQSRPPLAEGCVHGEGGVLCGCGVAAARGRWVCGFGSRCPWALC